MYKELKTNQRKAMNLMRAVADTERVTEALREHVPPLASSHHQVPHSRASCVEGTAVHMGRNCHRDNGPVSSGRRGTQPWACSPGDILPTSYCGSRGLRVTSGLCDPISQSPRAPPATPRKPWESPGHTCQPGSPGTSSLESGTRPQPPAQPPGRFCRDQGDIAARGPRHGSSATGSTHGM